MIEIFRDRSLLCLVRAELVDAGFDGDIELFPIDDLLEPPVLQSVYAEVLRLRAEVQTVFRHDREAIRIKNWQIPSKTIIITPTHPAHMDEGFWNTDMGRHPVDTFWNGRFLQGSDEPKRSRKLSLGGVRQN